MTDLGLPSENDTIMGYPVRDLIILTERMRCEDFTPEELHVNALAYMRGYEQARLEVQEAIHQATVGAFKAFRGGGTAVVIERTPENIYETMKRHIADVEAGL